MQLRDAVRVLAVVAVLGALPPAPASAADPDPAAATGTLRGTLQSAETGEPLPSATVRITSRRDLSFHVLLLTDPHGAFEADGLPEGPYEVRASLVGYETSVVDEVEVAGSGPLEVVLALVPEAVPLRAVVVSASRREEKVFDAPASVQVIDAEDIRACPSLTVAGHLKSLPTVDVAQTGLHQATVAVRGFNNVFSGATLMLVDNRIARLPSLRYNAMNLVPTLDDDLERIEVVAGPGSALYGPNAANGVVHLIRRSPFDSPGTSVTAMGGERDLLLGSARHAAAPSDKVAYEIGVLSYRGTDFEYRDPAEQAARERALEAGADPAALRIARRDFDIAKTSVEGRLDLRTRPGVEATLESGWNRVDAIELTGVGAVQAQDFSTGYGQARLRWNEFSGQAYLNRANSGDTYNLRTGEDLVDHSTFFATQLQHRWLPSTRETLGYGVDVQLTRPDTERTINGRNERDDDIDEFGAYVQSETNLDARWSVIAAARLDHHNRLEDPVFSPRAVLAFAPTPEHKLRVTYNRAYTTPTPNNFFLDVLVLDETDGYAVRARGVPEGGFRFRRDSGGGLDGLWMRSPGVANALPAESTLRWEFLQQALLVEQGIDLTGVPAPDASQVGTRLRVLDPSTDRFTDVDPSFVRDVGAMQPTINNTFELGYKGWIGHRLVARLDLWHSRIKDFVGPLRVETPNVFADSASLQTYLSEPGLGLTPAEIEAAADFARDVPLGTVVPENAGDGADVLLTYRNFGDVDLSGADLSLEWLADPRWTFSLGYSYASKDFFRDEGGITDIALNAPRHKANACAVFHDEERGLRAGVRMRYVDTFPVLSGTFSGEVDWYTVVDASASLDVPGTPGTNVSLLAQNVLDNAHREFVGAPRLERVVLLRLTQSF